MLKKKKNWLDMLGWNVSIFQFEGISWQWPDFLSISTVWQFYSQTENVVYKVADIWSSGIDPVWLPEVINI